ncbi:MAG: class I SAM-dependent methyltransferase [Saprospirales bacterium]|nr:class I SAM-dependent methyltransferase [Saprospirales bacterium]
MPIKSAYNHWAATYDSMPNKTRDLEQTAARQTLGPLKFATVLELGCGTGKNTQWLAKKATTLLALDFSEEMLALAKKKITANHVQFQQADLLQPWNVPDHFADLLTCSLVLEHIEDLDPIFAQAATKLKPGGLFYICELHPFKQYEGSKAKYQTEAGTVELEVYTHHISEFVGAALSNAFTLTELKEWFDPSENATPPA